MTGKESLIAFFRVQRTLVCGDELTDAEIEELLEKGREEADRMMRNMPTMPGYYR